MGPKKDAVVEKVLLGRPGNSLKSGIVCEQNIFLSIIALLVSLRLYRRFTKEGKFFSRLA
jgi:hypothetical protein